MYTSGLPVADAAGSEEPTVVWGHPRNWKADPRTRRYISFAERSHSEESELGILRRSVRVMLERQDARGSFYNDQEYTQGDKIDDQLGCAATLAYHLARFGSDQIIREALERGVRFHLDHLVFQLPDGGGRYTPWILDRNAGGDWCNTLWCLWGAALVLRHGVPFLTSGTADELRELAADYWSFLSSYPMREENPCHNQLLAYCEIGVLYAKAVGRPAVVTQVLDYYHGLLRHARIRDRGHQIFAEFNRWDIHYGVLSWMMLEHLAAATGDPACAEDAREMALYFNEQVSAGGFSWGGSRNNECGLEEFPHLFAAHAQELGLNRILFQEPANLWPRLAVDGHYGRGLVTRMEVALPTQGSMRPLLPTPWHFQRDRTSVCLQDDTKLHHLCSAGLELIPAATAREITPTLRWRTGGVWKEDPLINHPPASSEAFRFCDSKPIELDDVTGLTSAQRGYLWEIRQWWLGSGANVLWIGQLIPHYSPHCDQIDFVLGIPVVTRLDGCAVPVTEVESAEGQRADTQGEPVSVLTTSHLRFGGVFVGATLPLEFVRPSKDALHTFPSGPLWRDFTSSNELRLRVSTTPRVVECRESIFFAVEIGEAVPALQASREPLVWTAKSGARTFRARQVGGVWGYTWKAADSDAEILPHVSFRGRAAQTSAVSKIAPMK